MNSKLSKNEEATVFSNREFSTRVTGYNPDLLDKIAGEMAPAANGVMMQGKDKENALDNVNKGNIGLWSARAMLFIFLWYFFSALTLFLNKYILTTMHGDAVLLSK